MGGEKLLHRQQNHLTIGVRICGRPEQGRERPLLGERLFRHRPGLCAGGENKRAQACERQLSHGVLLCWNCVAGLIVTRWMRLPSIPAGVHVKAWPPVLATWGPGFRGALHSHHSLHFVLAIEGELRVRTEVSGRWLSSPGVLTAADSPHDIDSEGAEVLLVFLDPESEAGAAFRPILDRPVRLLSAEERAELVRDVIPKTLLR